MDCKKIMELHRIEDRSESKKIKEIAKLTINFLNQNDIPFTPANYDEWFYVICRAKEERHLLTPANLKILYKKYRGDLLDEIDLEKKEMKEITKDLKDVTTQSNEILNRFEGNINEHSSVIDESITAIDEHNIPKMESLKERIKKLEMENNNLKFFLKKNRNRLNILEAKFNETKKEADVDALTKIFNRKRFDRDIEKFEKSCDTYSLIFIDIDHFKKINDTFGHQTGDKVLQELGEILTNYVRRNTYAYRYGGEEFVVVLPEGTKEAASVVANRLRKVIEQRTIHTEDGKIINFTASFGAAQKEPGESFKDVLKRADEALYEAKRKGRNRVVIK